MKKFIGIIPARYDSTRFPGKPLCDIEGKPMIWHVYQQAMKWEKFDMVCVATNSGVIMGVCNSYNIPCYMTSNKHHDCLDRAYEVAECLHASGEGAERYIIIQGDEPLFNPRTLDTDYTPECINFMTNSLADIDDPNAPKVVVNLISEAMYMSRHPIPYQDDKTSRNDNKVVTFKQLGICAFSLGMLMIYHRLQPTPLENAEGIGLNRLLENGYKVTMRWTPFDSISVDTPADRETVLRILRDRE